MGSGEVITEVVAVGFVEDLLDMIERQRGQLSLAFSVLAELGFDLNEWMDTISLN